MFSVWEDIDIPALIDKIEELGDKSGITVSFNPVQMNECKVNIEGLGYLIEVEPDSVSISAHYRTNPGELMNAFREAHAKIANSASLKEIELY